MLNGMSMTNNIRADPRTAIPATNSSPQKISNHGKAAAIEVSKIGLFTISYCRTNFRNSSGCNALLRPI